MGELGKAGAVRRGVLPLLVALACLRLGGDAGVEAAPAQMAFADAMPATVLWAWEEPEDLQGLQGSVGVAYLAETIELGGDAGFGEPVGPAGLGISLHPRQQRLFVPPDAAMMAVVRVEARQGFRDTPEARAVTADLIAQAAQHPGTRAVQVDFDATRSQRAFYAAILDQVRLQIAAGMPLSITALTSWCDGSASGWLRSLPIDEAVPMFFRLGGHSRPYAAKDASTVREPLCRRAVGLSTDESWPAPRDGETIAARRVYLFSPTPWTAPQLVAAAALRPEGDREAALRVRDDAAHATYGINDTGLSRPRPTQQTGAAQP